MAAVKTTFNSDKSHSYINIPGCMGCHKSMISRRVKQDNVYSFYCKSRGMRLKVVLKETIKVKAAAFLRVVRKGAAGMIRLYSDENYFEQDQMTNSQNNRWICKDIWEFPVPEHTKFFSFVMVLGVISNEGHVMFSFFIPRAWRSLPRTTRKFWKHCEAMDRRNRWQTTLGFQQDSPAAHISKRTQR